MATKTKSKGLLKVEIRNRWTGDVQFVAEVEADETAPLGVRIGLAVKWAIGDGADLRSANLSGADLGGADLRSANLSGANLYGADLRSANLRSADLYGADLRSANLSGADLRSADLYGADLRSANLRSANLSGAKGISDRIIDAGIRSDGYRFLLTRTEDGPPRIKAGCRNFTVAEGHAHWDATRPGGDPLGDETRLILSHMAAVAKLRGWPVEPEA